MQKVAANLGAIKLMVYREVLVSPSAEILSKVVRSSYLDR